MTERFLDYLKYEKNRSQLTVNSYRKDLAAFEEFFKGKDEQLSWESIDPDIIRDWMESMLDKGNTATTINRRLSALRSLYRFALSRELVDTDPARNIVGPKKKKLLPRFVKESEMDQLLDLCEEDDNIETVRARTIILLFYSTGMRLAELTGLSVGDVDLENRQVKVTGKRNKQRIIPFGDEMADTLKAYLELRSQTAPAGEEAFFLTRKGEPMNSTQVRYLVKKNLKKVSSQKKLTPHVLRHSFATAMLNHEAGLESVRKLLGHESLTTTEIYTHTTFEQLKEAYRKAHPRE